MLGWTSLPCLRLIRQRTLVLHGDDDQLVPPFNARRLVNMMQPGRALTAGLGLDPPVKALLVYNAPPGHRRPEAATRDRGLARPDLFTVVHDVFVTDTVRYADILLPPSSAVEHSTSPGRTDICT